MQFYFSILLLLTKTIIFCELETNTSKKSKDYPAAEVGREDGLFFNVWICY